MNFSPIIIVGGEPQSIFLEIFLKAIKKKKILINPYYFNFIKRFVEKKYKKI